MWVNAFRAGFKKPTIVQKYAIPMVAAKRDLIAVAQTGILIFQVEKISIQVENI